MKALEKLFEANGFWCKGNFYFMNKNKSNGKVTPGDEQGVTWKTNWKQNGHEKCIHFVNT